MNRNEAYKTLELNDNASEDEIKKAFRKLASEHHPDKNKDDKSAEDRFKKINSAYQILTGKEKADDDFQQQMFSQSPFSGNPFDFMMHNFGDFFSNASNHKQSRIQINDLFIVENLTFEESALGCSKQIIYNVQRFCDECDTSGIDLKNGNKCNQCGGSGFIQKKFNNSFIISFQNFPCRKCNGAGIISGPCKKCGGRGYNLEEMKFTMKIPPIGNNKTRMVAKEKGHIYKNIKSDVIIDVVPKTDGDGEFLNYFIENKNIKSTINITLDKLLFGGETEVKTINKNFEKIIIPKSSKVGDEIVINNNGVGNKGNHIVCLDIEYPDPNKLNDETKKVLEDLYK